VHSNEKSPDDYLKKSFRDCFEIVDEKVKPPELIKFKHI